MSACVDCREILRHQSTFETPILKRFSFSDLQTRSKTKSCGLCRIIIFSVKYLTDPESQRDLPECSCLAEAVMNKPEDLVVSVSVSSKAFDNQKSGGARDVYKILFNILPNCDHAVDDELFEFRYTAHAEYDNSSAKFISQRASDPSTDSPEAYGKILGWIAACDREHTLCRRDAPMRLPTRVIDVCSQDGTDGPRLHISRPDEYHPYLTLSYCWGTAQPVHLRSTNLEEMCNGIDAPTLPKSLQDAITVTKQLNFRYLWVDSLCIIQDSDEDKSHEISNMANVYQGSHLTINAAKAYNCNEGFLEPQPLTRSYRDPNLAVRVPLLHNDDEELGQLILEEDIFCADPGEPTYRRAWTFQERLLSRRQLIYGFDTLTWKCTTTTWNWVTWIRFCFQTPILGSLALPSDDIVTSFTNAASSPPADDDLSLRKTPAFGNNAPQWRTASWPYFQHYWLELVGIYSPLRLTDSADKLPGIAGVAAEVSRVSTVTGLPAGRYLAGLWEADLPRQLLWTVYYPSEPEERGRPYRAPSWSWASAVGDVYAHYPWVVQEYCSLSAAQVVECETTPVRAEAPFGQVKDGFLKMRARLVRGTAVGEHLGSSDGPITGEREFYQMDVVESVEAAKERALSSWWAQLGECCGLVLEKVEGEPGEGGLYRRVGIFHSETTSFPDVEPSVFTII